MRKTRTAACLSLFVLFLLAGCGRDASALTCRPDVEDGLRNLAEYYPDVSFTIYSTDGDGELSECFKYTYSSLDNDEERTGRFARLVSLGSPAVPHLLENVKTGDNPTRFFAILVLGELKDKTAIPDIVRHLDDEETQIRGAAAWALGLIRNREATNALISKLTDKDESVRILAAQALGYIKDAKAETSLIQLLQSEKEDYYVSVALARALGHMRSAKAVRPLVEQLRSADSTLLHTVTRALRRIKSKDVIALVLKVLPDCDMEHAYSIIEIFGEFGSQAEEPMLAALEDSSEKVRGIAAGVLGNLKSTKAIEPLIRAAKDDSAYVRESTADALGEIGGSQVIESLIMLLHDENAKVRIASAYSLSRIKSKRTADHLIGALEDEEYRVRMYAASALGDIGDSSAIRPLIKVLKGAYGHDGDAARKSLVKLGANAVSLLIQILNESDEDIRGEVIWILGKIGKPAFPELHASLGNSELRFHVALALGIAGDQMAVPHLISALEEGEERMRSYAARVLGHLKGKAKAAVPALIAALNDTVAEVRERASRSLGEIGDARAVVPLTTALKDNDEDVRCQAALALRDMGDARALPALYEALNDEDSSVRSFSQDAIDRITGKKTDSPMRIVKKKKKAKKR